MTTNVLGFALFASMLALAGCSSSSKNEGGTTHADAATDVAVVDGSDDAPPPPPPCDPNEEVGDGIFVSASSGDDASGDGSMSQPLLTITAGIAAAQASGKDRVMLDQGSYKESITIPDLTDGLFVEGGWIATGAVWKRDCSADARNKTQILGAAAAVAAVSVDGVTSSSGLRTLSVLAPNHGVAAADESGRSSIAVWVNESVFSLTDVDVAASQGGAGGPASAGSEGGVTACVGTTDCASGAAGVPDGVPGSAGPAGTIGALGYTAGDGTNGGSGAPGQNGNPSAQPPQSATCPQGCHFPGGCGCDADPAVFVAGGPGRCGCAGEAGGGGQAGRGGGASIAILATGSSTVSVLRAELISADGGNGSPGGAGGNGGSGASGIAGGNVTCVTGCGNGGVCGNCGTTVQSTLNGGGPGGVGGSGSPGGTGGPGAGGDSFVVVELAPATVLLQSSSTSVGVGGKGATSAGKTAPNGAAESIHAIP